MRKGHRTIELGHGRFRGMMVDRILEAPGSDSFFRISALVNDFDRASVQSGYMGGLWELFVY